MDAPRPAAHAKVWWDAGAAVVLAALCALLLHASRQAADDAVRRYGHNTDSGAYGDLVAMCHLAPGALLFALAALAWRRRWPAARFLHGCAWGWCALPLVMVALLGLASLLH